MSVEAAGRSACVRKTKTKSSLVLALHLIQPVGALEHFAGLAAVGRPDEAVALHHVEDAGGAAVAQAEAALQG